MSSGPYTPEGPFSPGPTILIEPTGPTGPDPTILAMFPNAGTGSVEPPHIATLEELMASREATSVKEAADTAILNVLVNPTRETFRVPLFQWATTGFQSGYTLYTLILDTPAICADGEERAIGGYILYLTGKTIEQLCATIQSMMTGIQLFHSFRDNKIQLHVSKF